MSSRLSSRFSCVCPSFDLRLYWTCRAVQLLSAYFPHLYSAWHFLYRNNRLEQINCIYTHHLENYTNKWEQWEKHEIIKRWTRNNWRNWTKLRSMNSREIFESKENYEMSSTTKIRTHLSPCIFIFELVGVLIEYYTQLSEYGCQWQVNKYDWYGGRSNFVRTTPL